MSDMNGFSMVSLTKSRLPIVVVVLARGDACFTRSFTSDAATNQRNTL
jgi:hypothetical protein